MQSWMEVVLFNAISATVLAGIVALVARRIRQSAVVHVLWLLVLLKLITPPVFEIGIVPKWQQGQARLLASAAPGGEHLQDEPGRTAPFAPKEDVLGMASTGAGTDVASHSTVGALATLRNGALRLIPFLAAAGTLLLLALSLARLAFFRRRLQNVQAGPPDLQRRLNELARAFGIKEPPRLRIVAGRVPPSLWPGPGSGEILLPAGLLERLSDDECDALLAHELAHFKRRDHWLRPLELLVVALYWWHPVAWWARRNLRIAEEQACDAMVMHKFRNRSRIYAESLIKTVEFLAYPDRAVPLLATGAAGTARLKERIIMIRKNQSANRQYRALRPALYASLLLLLFVSPAWVEKAASAGDTSNPEHDHQQALLLMQEQEVQLQREMQKLEQERMSVRQKIDEKMMQQNIEALQQEIEALEKDGQQAEARELRQQILYLQQEAALHRKEMETQQAYAQARIQVEYQLQDLTLQIQKAELAGDLRRAGDLQQKIFGLEQELRKIEVEAMQKELQRQRERFEHEKAQLQKLDQ